MILTGIHRKRAIAHHKRHARLKRRQQIRDQAKAAVEMQAPIADHGIEDEDGAPWRPPVGGVMQLPPGSCRKCGRHIGRGVHLHEKACRGSEAAA